MAQEQGRKLIAQNKKARHDYHIEDTFEAGLVLTGTEVKSLRAGPGLAGRRLRARSRDGEAWLHGVHIPEYTLGHLDQPQPRRDAQAAAAPQARSAKLVGKTKEGGLTIVPLALYFKDGKAKVEIALATGKKSYDKRQALAERDSDRELARAMGRRSKGME